MTHKQAMGVEATVVAAMEVGVMALPEGTQMAMVAAEEEEEAMVLPPQEAMAIEGEASEGVSAPRAVARAGQEVAAVSPLPTSYHLVLKCLLRFEHE